MSETSSTDSSSGSLWAIGYSDTATKEQIERFVASSEVLTKKWNAFKATVTLNPFSSHKSKRIAKLKDTSFPKGTYRYRNDPLRVVYFPQRESKTVFPLAVDTASNISYKKRSKR